jgi:photosystem II stability/assembly factor-like uncharacterized protein
MRLKLLILVGLLYSTSADAQWQRLMEPYGGTINEIVSDGTTLYAAEGDYGAGDLYTSTDLGETWRSIGEGLPDHPLVLHVARIGARIYAGTSQGLYVTNDNGKSWKLAVDTSLHYRITMLHPEYEDLTFGIWNLGLFHLSAAGELTQYGLQRPASNEVHQLATAGGDMFAATQGSGVQRSTDGGKTWQAMNSGLPATEDLYVQALIAIHDTLIAGTLRGIYRSIDHGEHWTALGSSTSSWAMSLLATVSVIYANDGAYGVSTLTLGDTVWHRLPGALQFLSQHGLAIHSGKLFVGSQRMGVLRRSLDDTGWTNVSKGITSLSVVGLRSLPSGLFAGSLDADFGMGWRSNDHGNTWSPFQNLTNRGVHDFVQIGSTLLAGTDGEGVARSTDGGETWNATVTQLPGGSYVNGFAKTPSNIVMVTPGFSVDLAYSTDEGASWKESESHPNGNINEIYYDSTSSSAFALSSFGLWQSTTEGKSWTDISGDLVNVDLQAMTRSQGRLWTGGRTGLFSSADNGKTWIKSTQPDLNSKISAMTSNGDHLFIAANGKIYTSDRLDDWKEMAGLPADVKVLTLVAEPGFVYAGLEGLGLWRATVSETAAVKIQSNGDLTSDRVILRDVTGRAAWTAERVADLSRDAIGNLPSGFYFLESQSKGNHTFSRVLVTEHQLLISQ